MTTTAELYQIAWDVVGNYTGHVDATVTHGTVTDRLISLVSEMDGHMVSTADIEAETEPFVRLFDELPKGPRQRDKLNAAMLKIRDTQLARLDYLPLVRQLKEEMAERGVITFGEQMSLAATVAQRHPVVGRSQRQRFRVVMLDEYQDTSHAQRVLLSSLFGAPTQAGTPDTAPDVTVTAVGDPMQAIYGWRGATSANLERFVTDFPQHAETPTPAPKKELTTSWRNPGLVLDCANTVSEQVLGPAGSPTRTVQPLTPRPGAGDGEVDVDAVKQRPGDFLSVARDLVGGVAAGAFGVAVVAAGAGVHGGDELEAGGEVAFHRGAADGDMAVFQRFAQHFEDAAVEFGQFVEKEDAVVGKADFARFGDGAAANQRGGGAAGTSSALHRAGGTRSASA